MTWKSSNLVASKILKMASDFKEFREGNSGFKNGKKFLQGKFDSKNGEEFVADACP